MIPWVFNPALRAMSSRLFWCAWLVTLTAQFGHAAVVCRLSTAGLAFGDYDSTGQRDRDTNGMITVTCSGTVGDAVNYSLAAGPFVRSSGRRALLSPSARLDYNLYTDVARTLVWGDGTHGTVVINDSFSLRSTSVSHTYVVYGRILGGQRSSANSYRDNLVITLTY